MYIHWEEQPREQRDLDGLVQGLTAKRASVLETAWAASHADLREFLAETLELHPPGRLTPSRALLHAWLSPLA